LKVRRRSFGAGASLVSWLPAVNDSRLNWVAGRCGGGSGVVDTGILNVNGAMGGRLEVACRLELLEA